MSSIIIACATRFSQNDFFEKAALGKCLMHAFQNYPIQLEMFYQNSRGLGECYNQAIDNATDEDDILVFVHDDVHLLDFFWPDKLIQGFQHFDLLGLAGNVNRVPGQPAWAFTNAQFAWDDSKNLSGTVGHGKSFPCEISWFGPTWRDCKLLDGVLLAAKKKSFSQTGIRFDEDFKFHFYDMDICRQFESKTLKMGTIPLSIVHESGGAFGTPQWREGYAKYLAKWSE